MAKVSIIIPIFKAEKWIERCARSLFNQTLDEIEYIFVDDCSPDNSIAIAQRMIDTYKGIIDFKIIKNESNCGLSVARNNGLNQSTGKYIFFLDSDDYLREDCLQVLLGALKELPDAEVILGNFYDNRVNAPYISFHNNKQIVFDNPQLLKACYKGKIPLIAWNSLVVRNLITDYNLSFVPGLVHEDNLWILKLYSHVNKFVFVPQITMVYENNPISIMNTVGKDATQELPHLMIIFAELLDSFDEKHTLDYTFFLASFLYRMLDLANSCTTDQLMEVRTFRNKLFARSLRHGRFVLVLYELWMFNPLCKLFRYKFVRHNLYRIKRVTYAFASFFDHFHMCR